MRTHTKETQATMTPAKALMFLKEGNERFLNNLRLNRNLLQQVNETSAGQFPFAVILSCIDSRTSAELVFDQGLGDIFSVRVAGNVLNEDVLGSMEFACAVAGSRLIVVLGHSRCGAVKGACNGVEMGNLTGLLSKIRPAVEYSRKRGDQGCSDAEFIERVALQNTLRQMHQILERSPILRDLYDQGRIGFAAAMYSVESGKVEFVDTLIPSEQPATEGEPMAV